MYLSQSRQGPLDGITLQQAEPDKRNFINLEPLAPPWLRRFALGVLFPSPFNNSSFTQLISFVCVHSTYPIMGLTLYANKVKTDAMDVFLEKS